MFCPFLLHGQIVVIVYFPTLFNKRLTPISIKIHFEFLPPLLPLITSLKFHIPCFDFAFATLCKGLRFCTT
jgi:hypothetical protein